MWGHEAPLEQLWLLRSERESTEADLNIEPVCGSCDEEDGQSSAEVTLPLPQQDDSVSLVFSPRLRTVNLGAGAMWVPSADG